MRRISPLVPLFAVVLLGLLAAAGPAARAAVQEGTPLAEEEFAPEGVTFEPLGFGVSEELPAAPADLALARLTIEPGAGFPLDENDPSVALVSVESGALTVRAEDPIRVLRAATLAAFATPGAVEEGAVSEAEEVAAGTEVALEAGDSVVFPPNLEGEVRNDGQERALLLAAIVAPPEGEAGAPAEATPVA